LKRKIVFASHDPGGCNLLVPVIDALSNNPNYTIFLLMAGPAKVKTVGFSNFGVRKIELTTFPLENFPNEYDVLPSEIDVVLGEIKPDILFTSTSINSNIERYVIQYGKMSGVPTMSYIDSWIGEDIRFSSDKVNVCPDYILVCDEQMKVPYLKFESENCKVVTVGNPHLERLTADVQGETSIVQIEEDRILFFCENLKHYYPSEKFNEIAVLQSILSTYNYPRKLQIFVRPHPLESKAHWVDFINDSESRPNKFITISLDDTPDLRMSIKKSLLTFGVSSMALIEASIMGKYTFSFQVGIQGNKKFLYIPFETYGISSFGTIEEVCKQLSLAGSQHTGYKANNETSVIDKIMDLLNSL
jgi:hypothetical protein